MTSDLFAVWMISLIPLVALLPFLPSLARMAWAIVVCPIHRKAARSAVTCCIRHSNRWYRVTRVPAGICDWTETWCCPECGDRWCRPF